METYLKITLQAVALSSVLNHQEGSSDVKHGF